MKILVVQESDWLLRGPHQQHHLLERMSLLGHKIRVIDYEIMWKMSDNREWISKREVFEDVSRFYDGAVVTVIRPGIVKIPFFDKISIFYSHRREILRQVDEFSPDVILGLGILNTYLAMRIAKDRNIPFIYYLIDALHKLVPSKPLQFVAKEFEKKTLRGSDRVLVINNALKDYVVDHGADISRSYVLPAGIDYDKFNVSDREVIRDKYGIGDDDIVLFFMGWLYNFSGLVEVAYDLLNLKSEKKIKLLIVGEGDALGELEEIKKKYDLNNDIILTGWQPYETIPNLLSAADICLLPAYNNDIMQYIVPIKIYEYMASGKPVISTRLQGIEKEFGQGNGAIYADNTSQVFNKAVDLLNEPNDLLDAGLKARNYVSDQSWDTITSNFEDILQKAIE